jgi:hypothetical protein
MSSMSPLSGRFEKSSSALPSPTGCRPEETFLTRHVGAMC